MSSVIYLVVDAKMGTNHLGDAGAGPKVSGESAAFTAPTCFGMNRGQTAISEVLEARNLKADGTSRLDFSRLWRRAFEIFSLARVWGHKKRGLFFIIPLPYYTSLVELRGIAPLTS